MVMVNPTGERLDAKAARLRKAMQSAGSAPLMVAVEVIELASRWESLAEDAEGLDASAWLKKYLGQPLRYFELRAAAVDRIGKREAHGWDHLAAVWAMRFEDATQFRRLCDQVIFERKRKRGKLLSVIEVRLLAAKAGIVATSTRKAPACARCERMAKALLAAGLPVPD